MHVATSHGLGEDAFTTKHYLTLNLPIALYIMYPQQRIQCELNIDHVIYSATKFEVATSNGLGGDTFTRNMTDR